MNQLPLNDKPQPEHFECSEDMIQRVAKEEERLGQLVRAEATQTGYGVYLMGTFIACGVAPLGLCILLPFADAKTIDSPAVQFVLFGGLILFVVTMIYLKSQEERRRLEGLRGAPVIASAEEKSAVAGYRHALAEWRRNSWETWETKDGHSFERDLGALLNSHGWKVSVTRATGDGGIDIIGSDLSGKPVVVQCKWWSDPCGVTVVRELAGVIAVHHGGAYGIVVCKGGFTAEARQFASQARISLWERDQIRAMLAHSEAS